MSHQDMTKESGNSVKTLAIRLDPAVHAQLSLIASLRGTTITDEIRSALDAHVTLARQSPELGTRADAARVSLQKEMLAREAAISALFGDTVSEPASPTQGRVRGRTGGGKA